jgi:hypothetical protein
LQTTDTCERFNDALRSAIARDDTQKFKHLLYGRDGTFQLEEQYLTQRCAAADAPGCTAQSIAMGRPDNELPPLICAAFAGSVETACLLIEAGADPNCVHNNDTPLMTAVRLSSIC